MTTATTGRNLAMPREIIKNILIGVAALVGLTAYAFSANDNLPDRTLSLLRGSWDSHDFYTRWTLTFTSDEDVLVDKDPGTYAIAGNRMRITSGDEITDLRYEISGDKLTVDYSDGTHRTYTKRDAGEAESRLQGVYYRLLNSGTSNDVVTFDGGNKFHVRVGAGESADGKATIEYSGLYRIEGDSIFLTYDDDSLDVLGIRSRGEDGEITKVISGDQVFGKSMPVVASSLADTYESTTVYGSPEPPILIYVPTPMPYVPVNSVGTVAPAPPVVTTSAPATRTPANSSTQSSSTSQPATRDFGSRRGNR